MVRQSPKQKTLISSRREHHGRMLAFTDSQLRTVWAAADRVPVEKRGVFLERLIPRLERQLGFTDADLNDAVRSTLAALIGGLVAASGYSPPLRSKLHRKVGIDEDGRRV